MGKNRHNKALWDYLEASGVLETGTEEEIKAVKRAYRKKYLLEFKRRQRSNKPEYNITFSKSNGEYELIERAAHKHAMSVTAFVRKASLAYLDRTYVVPNSLQIARLEQLLADCLNEIKNIVHKKEKFFWERDNKLERIEARIETLERQIEDALRYPTLLVQGDRQDKIT